MEVTVDVGNRRARRTSDRIRTLVARSAAAVALCLALAGAERAKAAGPPSTTAGSPDAGSISFSQLKGLLAMPAPGRVVLKPGEMTADGNPSKGIVIKTADEQIIAPSAGLVVYAGEFRTYGQLLIISPGEGYHVLVAGLAQIDVAVGKSVSAGDRIGKARKGEALTVELRKDAQPLDGTEWFNLPKAAPMK
jgi:septal ring factor EnvC (AmiA/AmiB activator)